LPLLCTQGGESDKFTPRAIKSVLLGYTFGLKGYKLYDIEHKRIFHSRDVAFEETEFPFQSSLVSKASNVGALIDDFLFPIIDSQFLTTHTLSLYLLIRKKLPFLRVRMTL